MQLTLAEELFILSINTRKGTLFSTAASAIDYALSGAVLMELELSGRIRREQEMILAEGLQNTGNELLDEAYSMIQASAKPKNAVHWIYQAGPTRKLRQKIVEKLRVKGILSVEKTRILAIFPTVRYILNNPSIREHLMQKLTRTAEGKETAGSHTLRLLSMIRAVDLLNRLFPKELGSKAVALTAGEFEKGSIPRAVVDSVIGVYTSLMGAGVACFSGSIALATTGSSSLAHILGLALMAFAIVLYCIYIPGMLKWYSIPKAGKT